jgi:hypothetical protein
MPKPEWIGNKLGEDHLQGVVPPPWTPLSVSTDPLTINCWGRAYTFGGATALPTQIQSLQAQLLAYPVELRLYVNGAKTPLSWTRTDPLFRQEVNAVSTPISRMAYASLGKATVQLTTSATVEYDGFAWFELSLAGLPAGATIDELDLEIPVHSGAALYTHRTLPLNDPKITTFKSYSGPAIHQNGPGGLVDWVESFIPYWWLGNNRAGLQLTIEDARAWPNWNSPDAKNDLYPMELRSIPASDFPTSSPAFMLLRLRLLRKQALPAGWKFQFGLQATPVKPIPADWRKWRLRSNNPLPYNDPLGGKAGTVRVAELCGQAPEREWTVAFGYPEIEHADVANYGAAVSAIQKAGGQVAQYALLTEMSNFSPEWAAYGPSWMATPSWPCDLAGGFPQGASLCNTDPTSTFADFIVWKSNEFLANNKTDGFYHDQTVLYFKLPGWVDGANTPQPTFPIRAYRDLYRRIYTLAKKRSPGCLLFANMSGEMNIAVLAYEDACLNGEQLIPRLPKGQKYIENYIPPIFEEIGGSSILTLQEFRTEFMGRQWGLIPIFYPYSNPYGADGGVGAAATDEMLAILMLHDVGLFGDYADEGRIVELYTNLDTFGIVDTEFYPYFDSPAPLDLSAPNVYASVYKRPDGHALVVLANFNGVDVQTTLKFHKNVFPTIGKVESWTPSPVATLAPVQGFYQVTLPGPQNATEPNPRIYKLLHVTP